MGENLRPQFDEIDGLINEVDAQTAKEQKALLAEIDDLSIEVDKGFDVMEQKKMLMAVEKLGKENVFGPNEVEKTFGVRLEEVPYIPFSAEELERARELSQMLVLRVDKTADGKTLSLEAMCSIMAKRWHRKYKGSLLSTSGLSPIYGEEHNKTWRDVTGADDFTNVAPRSGWALASKGLLPESTDKDYIEQTEVIIKALKESVFKDMELPKEYAEAIAEFESQKGIVNELLKPNYKANYDQAEAAKLFSNQREAAKQLSNLKITQLTRASIQETVYDFAMCFDNYNKCLLPDLSTWSNSLSSDGRLVCLGNAEDNQGVRGLRGNGIIASFKFQFVGASLSRRS